MSWALGYDPNWNRDIGYGVPAICDHPDCNAKIDRGLSFVCGDDVYGGEHGCGLYFCGEHLLFDLEVDDMPPRCERCLAEDAEPFTPKPDTPEWLRWKLRDTSWMQWREENPEAVQAIRDRLRQEGTTPIGEKS